MVDSHGVKTSTQSDFYTVRGLLGVVTVRASQEGVAALLHPRFTRYTRQKHPKTVEDNGDTAALR